MKQYQPGAELTAIQKSWLSFCLTGILMVNAVCWAKFERASIGSYKLAALSWMFRKSKISWDFILFASVKLIFKKFGITGGVLVFDESDRARSKTTKRIYKTHKQKHKASGGYVNGQTVVLLLLVTDSITIPVGFKFYMPDPVVSAWNKEEERLKKKGIPKSKRPVKPALNPEYPKKIQLALLLLENFKKDHPEITVKCILGDALYGPDEFMSGASDLFGGIQVISQLKSTQNIQFRGKKKTVKDYFDVTNKGVKATIRVRGGEEQNVTISSARLKVDAHGGKKRFVIALKYDGEKDYRYIVATDVSWRTIDIIQAYSLRWLVEVFFEDWKLYEGWGQEAKQYDEEGSSRGLILSLLLDHCLLLHPKQKACVENKLPVFTVGSLQRRAQMDVLLESVKSLLKEQDPGSKLKEMGQVIKDFFCLMPSKKHMSGRPMGRLEPTPSLALK
nr:transposase [Desulfobacter hydrogenophilus]